MRPNRISRSSVIISDTFQQCLKTLTAYPAIEADWLDMLSGLEYVGCRKILKAVAYDQVTLSVLQHASEEASHAFLLKAAAERLAPEKRGRSWAQSPLQAAGWTYFRELDRRVSALPPEAGAYYPAVSWGIEQRVLQVYPVYLELSERSEVKRALRQILAQEKRHGSQFEDMGLPPAYRAQIAAIEAELWSDFVTAIETHLESAVKLEESCPMAVSMT